MSVENPSETRQTISILWLLVKIAIVLLFAGASGVIPVYQGF